MMSQGLRQGKVRKIAATTLVVVLLFAGAVVAAESFEFTVVGEYDVLFETGRVHDVDGCFSIQTRDWETWVIDQETGDVVDRSDHLFYGTWNGRPIVVRPGEFRALDVRTLEEEVLPVSLWREYMRHAGRPGLEYEEHLQLGYVETTEYGGGLYADLVWYDLRTQETQEFVIDDTGRQPDRSFPRDISPDGRLLLITRDGVETVVEMDTGEILGGQRLARNLGSMAILGFSEMISPALFKSILPMEHHGDGYVFSLRAYDGTPVGSIRAYLPTGELLSPSWGGFDMYFSRDLTRAITTGSLDLDPPTKLLDTTPFRDWLLDLGLLFRETGGQVTSAELEVRRFARDDSRIRGTLSGGTTVRVLDRTAQEVEHRGTRAYWYEVEAGELRGWAHGSGLELDEEQGPIPPEDWQPVNDVEMHPWPLE